MINIFRRVPWKLLKIKISFFRRRFAKTEWPEEQPSLVIPVRTPLLREILRLNGWEKAPYSLKIKDEVLNFRKPTGIIDDIVMEYHLYARRKKSDGIEVCVHIEPSRFEAKTAHFDESKRVYLTENEIQKLLFNTRL